MRSVVYSVGDEVDAELAPSHSNQATLLTVRLTPLTVIEPL
jgi:hypothetical protein